jgi:L-arabinose isomerase
METTPETIFAGIEQVGLIARVALLSVRFTMFDPQMDADFPQRMRNHAARSADLLRSRFDVVECPLVEGLDDARTAAEVLRSASPDVIVFAPSMAAPPSFATEALAGTDAPIVIWNAPSPQMLAADLRQAEATEHTTTVGSVMFANVLSRAGRPVVVATARHDDAEGVERVLRVVGAAAAARGLRGATFLRLGDPLPGYLDVMADVEELAALGVHEVAIDRERWTAAVSDVRDEDARDLLESVRALGWEGSGGPAEHLSARVAVALDRVIADAVARGATVNCHGGWFRDSSDIGVTACLGVACQAARGRSVSCTGDLPTAMALSLARSVAGAALYGEIYVPEPATGLALVAAGGEGDPAWAEPGTPVRLEPNTHYPGRNGDGTAVSFPLRRGPATLLSLSPSHDGWVLAWATGEIEESRFPNLGGPNGMFRFDSGPVEDAVNRWIASGASHHIALAPGRLDLEVPVVATTLAIRAVRC